METLLSRMAKGKVISGIESMGHHATHTRSRTRHSDPSITSVAEYTAKDFIQRRVTSLLTGIKREV